MIPWTWHDVGKTLGWMLLIITAEFIVNLAAIGILSQENSSFSLPIWLIATNIAVINLALIWAVYKFTVKKYGIPYSSLGILHPFDKWIDSFFLIFIIQVVGAVIVNPLFYSQRLKKEARDSTEEVIDGSTETEASEELDLENPQIELITRGNSPTTLDIIFLFFALCIVVPIAEELFFRGMLHPLLRKKFSALVSILFGAALFALLHFIPILLPPLFVLGLVLSWVREKSGSVVPGMVLHALQNGIFVAAISLR